MRLDGAVALVTGASSGIGAATARRLAAAGSTLVLVGRDATALDAVARDTGGHAVRADLAEADAPDRVAAAASAHAGVVDVLVLNAGVGAAGPFATMAPADIDRLVAVNLLAPLRLTRALLPGMVARERGHIVAVSSIAGHAGVRDEAVYSATKAALSMFCEAVRYEVAEASVGVSTVVPGVVDTPFFARRGRPYGRSWPPPIAATRVADAVVRAVVDERAEVVVPGWLTVALRVRGALPAAYRRLAGRFG